MKILTTTILSITLVLIGFAPAYSMDKKMDKTDDMATSKTMQHDDMKKTDGMMKDDGMHMKKDDMMKDDGMHMKKDDMMKDDGMGMKKDDMMKKDM